MIPPLAIKKTNDPFAQKPAPTLPGWYWFKGGIPAKLSIIKLEERDGKIYRAGSDMIPSESKSYKMAQWGPKIEPPTE